MRQPARSSECLPVLRSTGEHPVGVRDRSWAGAVVRLDGGPQSVTAHVAGEEPCGNLKVLLGAPTAAERIRLELASYFASPSPAAAAAIAANTPPATSYTDRLTPSAVQTPRERALGSPTDQIASPNLFDRAAQPSVPAPDTATPSDLAPAKP